MLAVQRKSRHVTAVILKSRQINMIARCVASPAPFYISSHAQHAERKFWQVRSWGVSKNAEGCVQPINIYCMCSIWTRSSWAVQSVFHHGPLVIAQYPQEQYIYDVLQQLRHCCVLSFLNLNSQKCIFQFSPYGANSQQNKIIISWHWTSWARVNWFN